MRCLTLCLVLLFSLPLSARADDATKRAKIEQMLGLLHVDRSMNQIMDMMEKEAVAASNSRLSAKGANEAQKQRVADFQKQLFDFIGSQLGWKAMGPQYVEMYAQAFSEEDKSPAGVAMIEKTPELTQKAVVLSQKKMLLLEPELKQMIQDFASTAGKQSPAPMVN